MDAAFTPLEAITLGTLNGARYLGRDSSIGSIAAGKQADLVVVNGDPSTAIADIRKVEFVFRLGIGYDPAKLIESVAGRVGLFKNLFFVPFVLAFLRVGDGESTGASQGF